MRCSQLKENLAVFRRVRDEIRRMFAGYAAGVAINLKPNNEIKMNNEKKPRKGFFAILRESFTKTGGCCGAGETCGGPVKATDPAQTRATQMPKEAGKSAQK